MATNFPAEVDVFTNPESTDYLNNPSHAAQHANANDAIEALESFAIGHAVVTVGFDDGCDYVCDGTEDDVQIQAAIDALSIGETISVKEGTYDITATIILDDGILLKGCGKSTIFKLASGVNEDVFSGTSKTNINLADFKIDGNQTNNPTGDNGVNLLRCNNFIIHNIWTTECKLKGINASGGYDGIVAYCRSNSNSSNGITFATAGGDEGDECYGMLAFGNIIYDCGGSGGLCVITPTAGYLAPTNIRLIGNRIYDVAEGTNCIDCKGGEGIIISGNDIAGGQNGIDLGSTGFTAEGVIVTGNTIKNAQGYGVSLAPATNCLVTGNRIYDDQDTPTMDYAIYEGTGGDHNTIEGNDVTDGHTATKAMFKTGANTIIRNNKGYVTESSGTATIANGQTTVQVTHGLATTPTVDDIMVVPTNSMGNATKYYITSMHSAHFNITVNADPGATTATFAWKAIVL